MTESIEDKKLKILNLLNNENTPLSSKTISEKLLEEGVKISERTTRLYLKEMDDNGFTNYLPRNGRVITNKGRSEMDRVRAYEKVGFISSKIDEYSYGMNFDIATGMGTVLINISLISKKDIEKSVTLLKKAFQSGYSMGRKLALLYPEDSNDDFQIPEGSIGIGSVCSITLNGILLSRGIPVNSIFGGLMEVENNRPKRFVQILKYEGTSMDPLEIFIAGGFTDHLGICNTGNGFVGASFRDIPAVCLEEVESISKRCDEMGLGGILLTGYPGKSLLKIPVNQGRAGLILTGGLNVVSVLAESGIKVDSKTLSGFISFKKLFDYNEIDNHLK